MSLKDRIGPPPVKAAIGCGVKRAADELSTEDAADLYDMVADLNWGTESLRARLLGQGIRVSEEAMRKHRKHVCTCAEEKAVTRESERPRRKR
jgi:hypothetical protein